MSDRARAIARPLRAPCQCRLVQRAPRHGLHHRVRVRTRFVRHRGCDHAARTEAGATSHLLCCGTWAAGTSSAAEATSPDLAWHQSSGRIVVYRTLCDSRQALRDSLTADCFTELPPQPDGCAPPDSSKHLTLVRFAREGRHAHDNRVFAPPPA